MTACKDLQEKFYSKNNLNTIEKYRQKQIKRMREVATPIQFFALRVYMTKGYKPWNIILRSGMSSFINPIIIIIDANNLIELKKINQPGVSDSHPVFKAIDNLKKDIDIEQMPTKKIKDQLRNIFMVLTMEMLELWSKLLPISKDAVFIKYTGTLDYLEEIDEMKQVTSKDNKIYQRGFNSITTNPGDKNRFIQFSDQQKNCCGYYLNTMKGTKIIAVPPEYADETWENELIFPPGTVFDFYNCVVQEENKFTKSGFMKMYGVKINIPTTGKIIIVGEQKEKINDGVLVGVHEGSFIFDFDSDKILVLTAGDIPKFSVDKYDVISSPTYTSIVPIIPPSTKKKGFKRISL